MRAQPHASVEEHAALWQQEQGHSISDTTLWRTLRRMNWSHKKTVCAPASAKNRHEKSFAEPPAKQMRRVLSLLMKVVLTPA